MHRLQAKRKSGLPNEMRTTNNKGIVRLGKANELCAEFIQLNALWKMLCAYSKNARFFASIMRRFVKRKRKMLLWCKREIRAFVRIRGHKGRYRISIAINNFSYWISALNYDESRRINIFDCSVAALCAVLLRYEKWIAFDQGARARQATVICLWHGDRYMVSINFRFVCISDE